MPQNTPTSPTGLDALVEKAKEDLTKRLSITEAEINIVDARDVVWPNSSLGCPQPDMVYADVLTSGYLIILQANNQDYEYHAGKLSSEIIFCENPSPPVPGMSGDI